MSCVRPGPGEEGGRGGGYLEARARIIPASRNSCWLRSCPARNLSQSPLQMLAALSEATSQLPIRKADSNLAYAFWTAAVTASAPACRYPDTVLSTSIVAKMWQSASCSLQRSLAKAATVGAPRRVAYSYSTSQACPALGSASRLTSCSAWSHSL